jgi:hypothetical protein
MDAIENMVRRAGIAVLSADKRERDQSDRTVKRLLSKGSKDDYTYHLPPWPKNTDYTDHWDPLNQDRHINKTPGWVTGTGRGPEVE